MGKKNILPGVSPGVVAGRELLRAFREQQTLLKRYVELQKQTAALREEIVKSVGVTTYLETRMQADHPAELTAMQKEHADELAKAIRIQI